VVERHIGLLKDQVDQNNFGNCVSISADYTRFYVISGDVDEIFWGELTQNVFKEMSTLHQSFDVESKLDDIHAKWKQKLDSALAAFKSGKQTDMYASFRDMRVYMTELQFNAWHSSSPKRIPRRDRLFSE
jgi:hypothetical protein